MEAPVVTTFKPGRRGDAWTNHLTKVKHLTGVNFWSNAKVTCHLKTGPNAPIAYAFVLAPYVTLNEGYDTLNFRLDIPAAASRNIPPATYFGDIEVQSDTLKPVTLVAFTLLWLPDITQVP